MSTNNTSNHNQEKRQEAYQLMLEKVKKLVTEEGQSVQEATITIEKKLSKWVDLSKEELEKVTQEVKQDLSSFSEIFEESKEKIREKWQNEAEFAKQKALKTLSQIIEQANSGFGTLQKLIQEAIQPDESISLDSEDAEHQEHEIWHRDNEQWLKEIKRMQQEHESIPVLLDTIKNAYDDFDEQLEVIETAIKKQEKVLEDHEKLLAEVGHEDPVHKKVHDVERETYAYHKKLMAQLKNKDKQALSHLNEALRLLKS